MVDNKTVEDLNNRSLDKTYLVVYSVKNKIQMQLNGKVIDKSLYTLIGITNMGRRKFIGCFIEENDNRYWLDILEKLKHKGIENILYMAVDNNTNIKRCLQISFPNTLVVPMAADVIGNIYKYFSDKFSTKIEKEIKELYTQNSKDDMMIKKQLLYEKYEDNQILKIIFNKYLTNIDTYYVYLLEIRQLIFSSYMLKLLKRKIEIEYENYGYINKEDDIVTLMLDNIIELEAHTSYTKKEWLNILNGFYKQFPDSIGLLV